jgi:two-component system response regulator YesN
MFSLLIADDEILTREGIIHALPWEKLGIDTIMQADDGIKGIEAATDCKPDIILTDVRMPNMDGIEMSRQIRRIYQDSKIIFMSGYSDKEYLMSAIQLKAVRYIEKPIKNDELIKAIQESVNECLEEQQRQIVEAETLKKLDICIPYIKSEFAIRLLNSNDKFDLSKEYHKLELANVSPESEFITVIVKIIDESFKKDFEYTGFRYKVLKNLENFMNIHNLRGISAFKDNSHLITHIFFNHKKTKELQENMLKDLFMKFCFNLDIEKYFISIGEKVTGISMVRESYKTAVLALQKAFFESYSNVFYYNEEKSESYVFDEKKIYDFIKFLSEGKRNEAECIIYNLTSEIRKCKNTKINYIKDIYYKFLVEMEINASKYNAITLTGKINNDYLWKAFNNLQTLDEVMKFVLIRIADYFETLEARKQDKSSIMKIISYIEKHYMNKDLSVKGISTSVYLSPAYMCTYFKQETGRTINQYITEYRLDKAKELLEEKANRVSDVAEMVGYSDGNYFTKLFKKSLGMTPSEFRERLG